MTDLFKKYGYAIDKLKINKGNKEIKLSIKFRIHELDSFYYSFYNKAQLYLPCMHIYNAEDVKRYEDKNFCATDEERRLYLEIIAVESTSAVASLFNQKSNSDIAATLLRKKDISRGKSFMQYNHNKRFHYEDGAFNYTEFFENTAVVRHLLKTLRNLKHYKHKPIKRDCTTDLWCTLEALDVFWS